MNKIFLFILVSFTLTIPTKAYSMSGQKYLKMCEEKKYPHNEYDKLSTWGCKFFFKGMRDMERLITFFPLYTDKGNDGIGDLVFDSETGDILVWKGDLSRLEKFQDSCIPDDVNIEQLHLIMTNWLKNHPEKIHLEMIYLYWVVMREAFPCD